MARPISLLAGVSEFTAANELIIWLMAMGKTTDFYRNRAFLIAAGIASAKTVVAVERLARTDRPATFCAERR